MVSIDLDQCSVTTQLLEHCSVNGLVCKTAGFIFTFICFFKKKVVFLKTILHISIERAEKQVRYWCLVERQYLDKDL